MEIWKEMWHKTLKQVKHHWQFDNVDYLANASTEKMINYEYSFMLGYMEDMEELYFRFDQIQNKYVSFSFKIYFQVQRLN